MTLKRAEWVKLVGEWRGSRQSARQFAMAHGVTDAALRYWAGRLADEDEEPRPTGDPSGSGRTVRATVPAPALARVVRAGGAPPAEVSGRIMVVVGKAAIVVERGFDERHLRDVVRALGEAG